MDMDVSPTLPLPAAVRRASVPNPHEKLTSRVDLRARPLRTAVGILEAGLASPCVATRFSLGFSPRCESTAPSPELEPRSARAAWALANIWLLARRMVGI